MANEKTPLRDTAPPSPERAQKTADRSTVARRRIVVGIIVALVVIAGLWFLFGRGEDGGIPFISSSAPEVPTFHFSKAQPKYEALQAHLAKAKLEKAAKHALPTIEKGTAQFLQAGYVNPDGWGDAGSIDDFFSTSIRESCPNRSNPEPGIHEYRWRDSHPRVQLTYKLSFGASGVAK